MRPTRLLLLTPCLLLCLAIVIACSSPPKKPKAPTPTIPVVVEAIPCSLPSFAEPRFLTGVPVAESKRPDGGFDQYIVTSDGLADFAAYLLSLYQWIEAASACLETR